MSLSSDIQRILEAASEANVNFGTSNPQLFVKSFFDSLPKDDILLEEHDTEGIFEFDNYSQIHSGSEFFTPSRSQKPKVTSEPPTPTLSLPDSFDGYFGARNYQDKNNTINDFMLNNIGCKRWISEIYIQLNADIF